jgi:hypothetical protein
MFFILQIAETLDSINKSTEGVSPGAEKTYWFLVSLLCAISIALGIAVYKVYVNSQKEVKDARQDYKDLADKSIILMSKVELHMAGQEKIEDQVKENRMLLVSIKDLINKS